MLNEVVLVRAIGGKPAKLVAVAAAHGLIYAANPTSIERIRSGESWPVGFPQSDVFCFDAVAYEALRELWAPTETLARDQWQGFKLKLYRPNLGELAT